MFVFDIVAWSLERKQAKILELVTFTGTDSIFPLACSFFPDPTKNMHFEFSKSKI